MKIFSQNFSQPRSFEAVKGILLCLIILSTFTVAVFAQTYKKLEVGGQFSVARFRDLYSGTQYDQYKTDIGFGGRGAFNFNRNVAVEGQFDFFPQSKNRTLQTPYLAVFGIKAGRRGEKIGAFIKIRPGFMQWSEQLVCVMPVINGQIPPPCPSVRRTNFAFDAGGVVEFYPSKRTLIRVDVGDVMTRIEKITGHNFQTSIGVGWRF